jgi:hypothetical protein
MRGPQVVAKAAINKQEKAMSTEPALGVNMGFAASSAK